MRSIQAAAQGGYSRRLDKRLVYNDVKVQAIQIPFLFLKKDIELSNSLFDIHENES